MTIPPEDIFLLDGVIIIVMTASSQWLHHVLFFHSQYSTKALPRATSLSWHQSTDVVGTTLIVHDPATWPVHADWTWISPCSKTIFCWLMITVLLIFYSAINFFLAFASASWYINLLMTINDVGNKWRIVNANDQINGFLSIPRIDCVISWVELNDWFFSVWTFDFRLTQLGCFAFEETLHKDDIFMLLFILRVNL